RLPHFQKAALISDKHNLIDVATYKFSRDLNDGFIATKCNLKWIAIARTN
ncbi:hypothetical protein M9458_033057, partial [Cirrhinus mrigala]